MTEKQNRLTGNQAAEPTAVFLNGNATDHTTNGGTRQPPDYWELAAQHDVEPPPDYEEMPSEVEQYFTPISLDELVAMPPKEWIIDQVIGKGDIGMIYGPPGCGKTFVVIDMIFAACLGQRFAMRFDVAKPLNVAYAAGEGISGLPSRFAAAKEFYEVDKLPNFTFFAQTPQLRLGDDSPFIHSIKRFVNEWQQRQAAGRAQPLDILVIDTLHSATAGADENSAKDMGIVLKLAKEAAQDLGCAVVLVHHTNKNGTAERGSSALRGAMDCMIEIKRISDTDTKAAMSCAKLKDGDEWKSQTFDLVAVRDSVRVWWDEPAQVNDPKSSKTEQDRIAIVRLLKDSPGVKYTAKRISEMIGMGESKHIFKLLKQIMDADNTIKTGLKNPERDASSTNPTMYWHESTYE